MKIRHSSGAVAPLAMIFAFVSMLITVAYLGSSSTINSQERFRFAEITAQYIAEAGLNKEAADYLPYMGGGDATTTLVDETGVDFGEDTQGNSLGKYKNVLCGTQLAENSTHTEFYGLSTGEVSYETPNGNEIIVERTASLIMTPMGFEEFMYFTNDEAPFGPNAGPTVNFGGSDVLEGRVHTNSPTITFSNYGCPTFLDRLSVTEPISYGGDTGCLNGLVDDNDESIIDTVNTILYPPDSSANILIANANRTFTADELITFAPNKKDTLIMTEIEFIETGGYFATQWWYLIPPVLNSGTEIEFNYDENTNTQTNPSVERFSLRLIREDLNGWVDGWEENQDYEYAQKVLVDVVDITEINSTRNRLRTFKPGDFVAIESEDTDKSLTFTIQDTNFVDIPLTISINTFRPITYSSSVDTGFVEDERVTLSRQGDGENINVPFNAFQFFHNHADDGETMCSGDGFHHFDYRYWLCDDRYDPVGCKEEESGRSFVYSDRLFFPVSGPEVIYVRGGPVLVHGTVKGQYTIVTDDSVEYRRHDDPDIVDQIWGNIWLIDDIRYEDSNTSSWYMTDGAVVQPDDGGTDNVLGLVAGGNVIIANTTPNGARNRGTTNPSSRHIVINAACMALHGAFISHYWQNSITPGTGACPTCAIPNLDDEPWFSLGDGRGGHRNPVRADTLSGIYTNNIDYRGYVNIWGSIVQQERGYMKRNAPCANADPDGDCYTSGDIGYDKNYHYDKNLLDNPPPYYPTQSTVDGAIVLRLKSFGLVTGE